MNDNIIKMQQIFKLCKFIEFCSVDELGYPEVRAMLNLANKDICPHLQSCYKDRKDILKEIYFTTNTSSKKAGQIIKNPKSSVYFYAPNSFGGVLLIGAAELLTDQKTKDLFWDDSWVMYYPKGRTDADYAVIKFTASRYKFYDGNFAVVEGAL